ncbi:helix-turn-helix transcriptional regulator [Gilliamella sp. CG13]|uniref:helix-turn-helix transcriptional regulator n=1 Tax=Gilliamella sp. CG13 TaxID=3351502 RepID=UPI0039878BE2
MVTIIKIRDVSRLTSLSKATIYRQIKKGVFPIPLQLTERNVGWLTSEIEEWINQKAKNRRGNNLLN